MTTVGVQYLNVQETKRANLALERHKTKELDETRRHNKQMEDETFRHNFITEDIAYGNLDELVRHNQANESIAWFNANEQQRHNQAQESVAWYNAKEQRRHNKEQEKESKRSNAARETLQDAQLVIQTASLLPSTMEHLWANDQLSKVGSSMPKVSVASASVLDFIGSGINRVLGTSLN